MTNKKNKLLTKSEQAFIEQYHEAKYHYFKDIQKYAKLLEKLTNL